MQRLGITAFLKTVVFGENSFVYDYCSIGHSLEVNEEVVNNFNEVFGSYSVPMDPIVCPFHPDKLTVIRNTQKFRDWNKARLLTNPIRVTSPVGGKSFKS